MAQDLHVAKAGRRKNLGFKLVTNIIQGAEAQGASTDSRGL